MGIDVAHLVLEALRHADDEIIDKSPDGAKRGNILAVAMVDLDTDHVLLKNGEVDGQMAKILDELAPGALDRDEPGLDRDLDCIRLPTTSVNRRREKKIQLLAVVPPEQEHDGTCSKVLPIPSLSHFQNFQCIFEGARSSSSWGPQFPPSLCSGGSALSDAIIAAIEQHVPFSGTSRVSSLWM
jgi:hypothetical protein